MTASASPSPFDPPPLRRLAPSCVEITDGAGRALRMCRRCIHLKAGRVMRIRVVQQVPNPNGPPTTTVIVASPALQTVVPQYVVPEGKADAVVANLRARQRGKFPLPRRADLHLTLVEPGKEPFTMVVPVAVWPSPWFLLGVVLLMAAPLVVNRFVELSKARNPFESAAALAADVEFLGAIAILIGFVAATLMLLGWAALWTGRIASDSE